MPCHSSPAWSSWLSWEGLLYHEVLPGVILIHSLVLCVCLFLFFSTALLPPGQTLNHCRIMKFILKINSCHSCWAITSNYKRDQHRWRLSRRGANIIKRSTANIILLFSELKEFCLKIYSLWPGNLFPVSCGFCSAGVLKIIGYLKNL